MTSANGLTGKVAVVTGGSAGIGLATAREMVSQGACVFITGRRQSELDRAVAEIGAGVTAVRADSADLDDLNRLFDVVARQIGRIDVLFANAGIAEGAGLGSITEDHFDRLFSVNVKGLVFTVQKALPLMPDGAAIILMSSTVAFRGAAGISVYSATKAAIRSLARCWILDLQERRIRINVISPGPIETPGMKAFAPNEAAANLFLQELGKTVPVGRVGSADEVARTVAFLASDGASFINGADIHIDGGLAQI